MEQEEVRKSVGCQSVLSLTALDVKRWRRAMLPLLQQANQQLESRIVLARQKLAMKQGILSPSSRPSCQLISTQAHSLTKSFSEIAEAGTASDPASSKNPVEEDVSPEHRFEVPGMEEMPVLLPAEEAELEPLPVITEAEAMTALGEMCARTPGRSQQLGKRFRADEAREMEPPRKSPRQATAESEPLSVITANQETTALGKMSSLLPAVTWECALPSSPPLAIISTSPSPSPELFASLPGPTEAEQSDYGILPSPLRQLKPVRPKRASALRRQKEPVEPELRLQTARVNSDFCPPALPSASAPQNQRLWSSLSSFSHSLPPGCRPPVVGVSKHRSYLQLLAGRLVSLRNFSHVSCRLCHGLAIPISPVHATVRRCLFCYFTKTACFQTTESLVAHLYVHRPPFRCALPGCEILFHDLASLANHVAVHGSNGQGLRPNRGKSSYEQLMKTYTPQNPPTYEKGDFGGLPGLSTGSKPSPPARPPLTPPLPLRVCHCRPPLHRRAWQSRRSADSLCPVPIPPTALLLSLALRLYLCPFSLSVLCPSSHRYSGSIVPTLSGITRG